MHTAGRLRYLVPRLPASEVATQVNRSLKNVFMEIADVSRLQRAEHIDNCRKSPRSTWNFVCPCVGLSFFVAKGEMTGWGWNPAQLAETSQSLHSGFSAFVDVFPTFGVSRLKGSPKSQHTNQHQKHKRCQSSSAGDICWASDPCNCSDGFLPAITDANGCWGSKGHFNLPDSKFWVSSLNIVSWE